MNRNDIVEFHGLPKRDAASFLRVCHEMTRNDCRMFPDLTYRKHFAHVLRRMNEIYRAGSTPTPKRPVSRPRRGKPGKRRYTPVNDSLRDRALRIEIIVATQYCNGDVDAADLALAELHLNSNRKDDAIARIVAVRILHA